MLETCNARGEQLQLPKFSDWDIVRIQTSVDSVRSHHKLQTRTHYSTQALDAFINGDCEAYNELTAATESQSFTV
jgi:hypothetical protein